MRWDWKHWFYQLGLAIDQLGNVLITPGSPSAWSDETLSSRAYRMEQKNRPWGKVMRPMIDALFFWEKEHCKQAYENERQRAHSPPEFREADHHNTQARKAKK